VGVHDAITARLADRAGFEALWLSSLELSASKALPDANVITLTEVAERVREIRRASELPILVDADNGYGADEIAVRAALEFEAAGASAICLEDNDFPKRCSFYAGIDRGLETVDDFCRRLSAVRAAIGPRVELIARTEALVAGLPPEEAVRRARAYVGAGADALFVQSSSGGGPVFEQVLAEVRSLAPVMLTPTAMAEASASGLAALGADLVIYSNVVIRALLKGVGEVLTDLRAAERLGAGQGRIAPLQSLFELTAAYQWLERPGSSPRVALER
jgi:2-methylisocitrate lyase-like PEP mutase family enzyme